ncbi:MAG: MOSC domain-containing protein [Phycisphaerae bacterium]
MKNEANRPAQGHLCAIAYRPTDGDLMREIECCEILLQRGLAKENRPAGHREVTLLSQAAWRRACADLGRDLPWYTRRANLLTEGVDLTQLIGKTLAIGTVEIRIHGESKPCRIMNQQYDGLRAALVPEGRGGVFGQVVAGGTIHVGDALAIGG